MQNQPNLLIASIRIIQAFSRIIIGTQAVAIARLLLAGTLLAGMLGAGTRPAMAATQLDIPGPAGSGDFGQYLTVLPNGNFVVADPAFDDGATLRVGAVYLYDGGTGALISTLTGSSVGDYVGSGGVTVLSDGDFVVSSPSWYNGAVINAGAVTWGDGATGVSGVVSAANSLVGGSSYDRVGNGGVTALSNGDYVVSSPEWDNVALINAGAVTWGNGVGGVSGVVSASNSLVGGSAYDDVGSGGVTALSLGGYVVSSPSWSSVFSDVGAVTWGDGSIGVGGAVSAANSLVGGSEDDLAGSSVTALSNGNYVVSSPSWDLVFPITNVGAVTWGDGSSGVTGVISTTNSLVGGTVGDQVGSGGVTVLSDGDYVVSSPDWDNGALVDAGAVAWRDGNSGVSGVVTMINSLVGDSANDQVGSGGVTALGNGNYVVSSPNWDNGALLDAGAVTWGDGGGGVSGTISAVNSLVGSFSNDQAGSGGVTALSSGNYVVSSPYAHIGYLSNAGAATWGDGSIGVSGMISTTNSLVGDSAYDQVGSGGVTVLSDGNYVVSSPDWDNGAAFDAGAVTWVEGGDVVTGVVTTTNSLVGGSPTVQVGSGGVTALSDGDYVVSSPSWDLVLPTTNVGAVTWVDGGSVATGVVTTTNSLVGGTANDQVGSGGVTALSNGNYVVSSPYADIGALYNAGAVTWGDGEGGVSGVVSAANSLVGGMSHETLGILPVTALRDGNYVVSSPSWNNGAGAVAWGSGGSGVSGAISAANSLVGSFSNDQVGSGGVTALSGGDYVVSSPYWRNGALGSAGAVTWGSRNNGVSGLISAQNSVLGQKVNGGNYIYWEYDALNHQLLVGRSAEDIVTIFGPDAYVYLPLVIKN